jgi:hypothetical protein
MRDLIIGDSDGDCNASVSKGLYNFGVRIEEPNTVDNGGF